MLVSIVCFDSAVGSALLDVEIVDADNDCKFVCASDDGLVSARRDGVV